MVHRGVQDRDGFAAVVDQVEHGGGQKAPVPHERRARLEEAMDRGEAFPVDPELDKDFYGIRERFLP